MNKRILKNNEVRYVPLSMMDGKPVATDGLLSVSYENCVKDPNSFEGTHRDAQNKLRTAQTDYHNSAPADRADKLADVTDAQREMDALNERMALQNAPKRPDALSDDYMAGTYDAMVMRLNP